MGSDANRLKLWQALNPEAGFTEYVEQLFLKTKTVTQNLSASPELKIEWEEKSARIMRLFDFYEIQRPTDEGEEALPISVQAGYAAVWDYLETRKNRYAPSVGKTSIDREDIQDALRLLGEIALKQGVTLKLTIFGGAAMVLVYSARQTTKDVDAILASEINPELFHLIIDKVAEMKGLPGDWLNEQVGAYVYQISEGEQVLSQPGIVVYAPLPAQLLAMKLTAWRDDKDRSDARRLVFELRGQMHKEEIWESMQPFIIYGKDRSVKDHFDLLWDELYGNA